MVEPRSLPVVDSVLDYEKLHRIGEGTYGVVYKARERSSGEVVALKKVRFESSRDGVPVTSVRELRVLQSCQHENIVQLKKVVTGSKADSLFLVFEFCEHDLGRLVDKLHRPFSLSEVKCLVKQLLGAVAYLHEHWIIHRDIKMSNLLYNSRGELKLCDFGLARYFPPTPSPMTPNVVTLWYRAPELLLGCETYGEAVDMWAVGCVLGELLRMEPLFPARGEIECLRMHCNLLGTPHLGIWPAMHKAPASSQLLLPAQPYNLLRQTFPSLSDSGIDLLNSLLTYDPAKRITARQALRHPFFREKPYPKQPRDMTTYPTTHDTLGADAPQPTAAAASAAAAGPGDSSRKRPWPGAGPGHSTAAGPSGAGRQELEARSGGSGLGELPAAARQLHRQIAAGREAEANRRLGQVFGGEGVPAAGARVTLLAPDQ